MFLLPYALRNTKNVGVKILSFVPLCIFAVFHVLPHFFPEFGVFVTQLSIYSTQGSYLNMHSFYLYLFLLMAFVLFGSIVVSLYFAVNGFMNLSSKSNYIVLWSLNIDHINSYIHDGMPLKFINPPYFANPNLGAQKGIFTLWEINKPIKSVSPMIVDIHVKVDRSPLDLLIHYICLKRLRIIRLLIINIIKT